MATLRARQVRAIEHVDGILPNSSRSCRAARGSLSWAITELFGEDGFFAHGSTEHPKVFEVPFLENLL